MTGIDLNKRIDFLHASLRYFSENEYHVTRICHEYVLLLVFDGILRFTEDGTQYEVHAGEYHIQKINSFQKGETASSAPKYLYVHFYAEQTNSDTALPFKGRFDCERAMSHMTRLDRLSHTNGTHIEKTAVFYELLLLIKQKNQYPDTADKIADFIQNEFLNDISLDRLCHEFHFSKNHIINIFRNKYGVTPVKYINELKLNRAEYLLEVTSDAAEAVAHNCGFNDYSHFYKLFCVKNGISPIEWRNKKHVQPSKY